MRIWMICQDCGYSLELFDYETYYKNDCDICGGKMVQDMNQGKKIESSHLGDNFPLADRERAIQDSIYSIGIGATWEVCESFSNFKLRLQYRDLFFKCGGRIPEVQILVEKNGKLFITE
jgi:hypothetical protein